LFVLRPIAARGARPTGRSQASSCGWLASRKSWRQKEVVHMATNPPKGAGRRGAVRQRSQFLAPNGNWAKRDAKTGRIMDQKQDGTPFKGVRREK
jgi:hypothetical protein